MGIRVWRHAHAAAFKWSLQQIFRRPFANALDVLAIGMLLALPALLAGLVFNGHKNMSRLTLYPQIALFLKSEVEIDKKTSLLKRVVRLTGGEVELVPKDKALGQLIKRAKLQDGASSFLNNPLPDVITVRYRGFLQPSVDIARLSSLPEVQEVVHDESASIRLAQLIHFSEMLIGWVGALSAMGLIVILVAMVRLQIVGFQEEMEIGQMLGATPRFIRRPLLYLVFLKSLLGGVIAWALVRACLYTLGTALEGTAALYGAAWPLEGLSILEGFALMALSALLAWVSARLTLGWELRFKQR